MYTIQDRARKISFRSLDVSEVTELWTSPDAQPSATNRDQWRETHKRFLIKLRNRDSWLGGVNETELHALMHSGWPEGADRVRKLAADFTDIPQPTSVKRRKIWSDQGDEIDRDRLYSGQVDTCWRRTVRQDTSAPQIITLVLPWCHASVVSHSSLFWGAAAGLVLADLLESAGYRVEVIACNSIVAGSDWLSVTNVTIKAAGDPLRLDSLTAVTAHAATYRYYGLPSVAHVPVRVGTGWAMWMIPISDAVKRLVNADLMPQPFRIIDWTYSEEVARKHIQETLALLNSRQKERVA